MATAIYEMLNIINGVEEGLLNVLCTKMAEKLGVSRRKVTDKMIGR
jgi:chemotaxis regulatin CheY-phosphate phosphatase CheZ